MPKRIPRARAEWTAWAQDAERESPALFRVGVLALAAVLMVAHYTMDELNYQPETTFWRRAAYWSDAWIFAVVPFLNWVVWRLVGGGSLRTLKPIAVMSAAMLAGSILAYCVPDMFRSIERMHLIRFETAVEKWPWFGFREYWQYWTVVVLIVGNLVLFLNWRRGRVTKSSPISNVSQRLVAARGSLILRLLAVVSAAAACGFTAFHLGVPRLPADRDIVWLARSGSVEPHLRGEFDYAIQHSLAEGQPLAPLLTHVKLADLQRRQFYPQLNDSLFREYVLSPQIDVVPLAELGWRQTLWEYFYPRVRRESDSLEAARIVARVLRERVGIDPSHDYRVGVETIWTQQMTDKTGFERIYVAALRSVGIAARLGESGQAELLHGEGWQPAPRPVVSSFQPEGFPVPEGGLVNFRNWAGDDWPGDGP